MKLVWMITNIIYIQFFVNIFYLIIQKVDNIIYIYIKKILYGLYKKKEKMLIL